MHLLLPLLLSCDDGAPTDTSTTPVIGDLPAFYGDRPKNLLVISVDTYRQDLLARFGGEAGVTPFMDELAANGMSLDQHTTCSNWTKGGMACALNGMYSFQWGLIPRLAEQEAGPPRSTLASMLATHGFDTMLITSNGWLLDAGLDGGYAYIEQPDVNRATTISEAGIAALEQRIGASDKPWFLHLHFIEPHAAYSPPSEYLADLEGLEDVPWNLADREQHYDLLPDWPEMTAEEQELLKAHLWIRYKGDVRWVDDELREVWADLEVRGLLEDTLVVLWNDHGEQFWEHDKQTHVWGLYKEENDGFAIFWADNIVPQAWTEPTNHIDIAPTILSALGLGSPYDWSGLPVGMADPLRPIFGESYSREGPKLSVSVGDMKLIYKWTGEKELYDMAADPLEQTNIYDPKDSRVVSMWQELTPVVDRWQVLVGGSAGDPVNPGP